MKKILSCPRSVSFIFSADQKRKKEQIVVFCPIISHSHPSRQCHLIHQLINITFLITPLNSITYIKKISPCLRNVSSLLHLNILHLFGYIKYLFHLLLQFIFLFTYMIISQSKCNQFAFKPIFFNFSLPYHSSFYPHSLAIFYTTSSTHLIQFELNTQLIRPQI